MTEPRTLVAYAMILAIIALVGFAWLRLTGERRGERRLERLAERGRRHRRDARRREEKGGR